MMLRASLPTCLAISSDEGEQSKVGLDAHSHARCLAQLDDGLAQLLVFSMWGGHVHFASHAEESEKQEAAEGSSSDVHAESVASRRRSWAD